MYFLAAHNSLLLVAQLTGVSFRHGEFRKQVIFVYTFSVLKFCLCVCVCVHVYVCVYVGMCEVLHGYVKATFFSVLL